MAKVKIFLNKEEDLQKVESDLLKAMNHHVSGAVHDHESFQDPAMAHVAERLEQSHAEMYKLMLEEIQSVIESEYRRNLGN